jgi:hypothetical protein
MPLIIGLINTVFRNIFGFWGFDSVPHMVFSGFGGTLTFIYIVLWMVIPEAKTASEKLEMRGEKVDLESIKNSVQDELQGVKGRAEKFGAEFSEKAKEWGKEVGERGKAFSAELSPAASKAGNGIGNAIGILFKAFFLFIAGVITFALFVAADGSVIFRSRIAGIEEFHFGGFLAEFPGRNYADLYSLEFRSSQ